MSPTIYVLGVVFGVVVAFIAVAIVIAHFAKVAGDSENAAEDEDEA